MSSGMTAVDMTVMGAWLFSRLAASNAAVFAVPLDPSMPPFAGC